MNDRTVHLGLGALLALPGAFLPLCFGDVLDRMPADNLGPALVVVLVGLGALEAAAVGPRLRRMPGGFWPLLVHGWISWARILLLSGVLIGVGMTLGMQHQPDRPARNLTDLLLIGLVSCALSSIYALVYGFVWGLIPIYGPIWTVLLRKALLARRPLQPEELPATVEPEGS